MVSILIAARNEEASILKCLHSLQGLTYPKDQLEIWIGDDDSTDATAQIVNRFIADKPHFHYHRITHNLGQARGKANVLAQLKHRAKGDYFLITDADARVPADWVQTMLAGCRPGVGIVSGVTVPQTTTMWAAFQAIDWIQALFFIQLLARQNIPVSAAGNNMLVTRQAYDSTGGYENLPFSISEDHQLFREVLRNGFGFTQLFAPGIAVETEAMPTFEDLMNQRKRWMNAAMQTPWYIRLLTLSPLFLLPVILVSFLRQPVTSLITWAGLLLMQAIFVLFCAHFLKARQLWKFAWIYPVYFHWATFATLIHYLLPAPALWKGRSYELAETT